MGTGAVEWRSDRRRCRRKYLASDRPAAWLVPVARVRHLWHRDRCHCEWRPPRAAMRTSAHAAAVTGVLSIRLLSNVALQLTADTKESCLLAALAGTYCYASA